MRFAHISDLHLTQTPESSAFIRDDIHAFVQDLAADIRTIAGVLDFVVLSGDLTDDGDPRSFAQADRIFSALGLPVFLVPGNHDGPAAFQAAKRDLRFLSEQDISCRVVDLGALRLLGIDTCVEAETTGAVRASDLDAVARELASDAASRLVIVMHHPPFPTGLTEYDAISRMENSDRFEALIQAADVPPVVLCGHVHRPYFARWHGASCFVAGSPAAPFAGDLPFGTSPLHRSDEHYSYFVHSLDAQGQHVMTSRAICPPKKDLP